MTRLPGWLRGYELAILLALLGIAAGGLIFVKLATEVREGETQGFDRELLLAMRRPGDLAPRGGLAMEEAVRDVSALGSTTILGLITAGTVIFLALDGKKHMAWFMLGSVLSGTVLSDLLKDVFQRPRPEIVPHLAYASNTSFPSGHSLMSAVAYLTLGALLARSHERRAVKVFFLVTAALLGFMVGVSRVYLGVHWPTDVLAGWTAGAVWAVLCWLVARWLQSRRTLEAESEQAPE
ncbi:MAG TPA: phosphatase PAP2 family protein [Bryobacteraceae bacterium]|nr:phosphatase PAP2 family protein [Bryobacteraceae bacterium]